MNNDTIKAAELKEAASASIDYVMKRDITENPADITCAFINGAEYMQAQKDEQIKELVEAIEYAISIDKVSYHNLSAGTLELFKQLIQKYKG